MAWSPSSPALLTSESEPSAAANLCFAAFVGRASCVPPPPGVLRFLALTGAPLVLPLAFLCLPLLVSP